MSLCEVLELTQQNQHFQFDKIDFVGSQWGSAELVSSGTTKPHRVFLGKPSDESKCWEGSLITRGPGPA